jgi:hypothetical protein
MTSDEAKSCLFEQCAVVYDGARYERITAILYRLDEAKRNIIVSAEILDKNRNTVVVAKLKDITKYGEWEK